MRARPWTWALLGLAVAVAGIKYRQRHSSGPDADVEGSPSTTKQFWARYREASDDRVAGRLSDALAAYDEALRLRPDHEDALYYRGNCAVDLGRYTEAIASYERLVSVSPKGSARGYIQLGLLHASLDERAPFDLPRAQRYFEQALEVEPDSGARLALGETALLGSRWDEARRLLGEVASGDAMSIAAPYLLGFLSWRSGESADAWRDFGIAVKRGERKKPALKWTEEGDVKADPALRWQALARQSITGGYWIRVRRFLTPPGATPNDMDTEYRRLQSALAAASARIKTRG